MRRYQHIIRRQCRNYSDATETIYTSLKALATHNQPVRYQSPTAERVSPRANFRKSDITCPGLHYFQKCYLSRANRRGRFYVIKWYCFVIHLLWHGISSENLKKNEFSEKWNSLVSNRPRCIPFCLRRRAATLLSTPPDIAHTTLFICRPICKNRGEFYQGHKSWWEVVEEVIT